MKWKTPPGDFYDTAIFSPFAPRPSEAQSDGRDQPTGLLARICGLPVIGGQAHIAGNQVASPVKRQNLWNP
jgi:hypothetical protein